MERVKKQHPSYGLLSFHRTNSNQGVSLFGSMIQQKNTILLTLKEGTVERGLNRNWYYGGKTLFEVEMSMSQFGELISSLNYGEGVPCTIHKRADNPERIMSCPYEDMTDLHLSEFSRHVEKEHRMVDSLMDALSEKLEKKTALTKKDKDEIKSLLIKLKNEVGANTTYQVKAFNEHVEEVINEAKVEIESFWDMRVRQVGESAIGRNLVENAENPVKLGIEDEKKA